MTRAFTIITTCANAMMAELYDRMPVILEQSDWPTLMGKVEGDPATLLRPTDRRRNATCVAGQQAGEESEEQRRGVVGGGERKGCSQLSFLILI